jgi:hypothetical protein
MLPKDLKAHDVLSMRRRSGYRVYGMGHHNETREVDVVTVALVV